jgi:putative hemolysin
LASLMLEELKRIPLGGEVVVANGWRLEVMEVDSNRIERVLVSRLDRMLVSAKFGSAR